MVAAAEIAGTMTVDTTVLDVSPAPDQVAEEATVAREDVVGDAEEDAARLPTKEQTTSREGSTCARGLLPVNSRSKRPLPTKSLRSSRGPRMLVVMANP